MVLGVPIPTLTRNTPNYTTVLPNQIPGRLAQIRARQTVPSRPASSHCLRRRVNTSSNDCHCTCLSSDRQGLLVGPAGTGEVGGLHQTEDGVARWCRVKATSTDRARARRHLRYCRECVRPDTGSVALVVGDAAALLGRLVVQHMIAVGNHDAYGDERLAGEVADVAAGAPLESSVTAHVVGVRSPCSTSHRRT